MAAKVVSVYVEAATRGTGNFPRAKVTSVYAEALTRKPGVNAKVTSCYAEVLVNGTLFTPVVTVTEFVGWGVPRI